MRIKRRVPGLCVASLVDVSVDFAPSEDGWNCRLIRKCEFTSGNSGPISEGVMGYVSLPQASRPRLPGPLGRLRGLVRPERLLPCPGGPAAEQAGGRSKRSGAVL